MLGVKHQTRESDMNEHQIAWAQSHDWYLDSYNGTVLVLQTEFDADDNHTDTHVEFSDYRALREWAGY